MINLATCLQNNIHIIGNNCQNIGKIEGSGIFAKKVIMSYETDKGWQCVKINRIVLFFRKIFGWENPMHLSTIARGLNLALDKNRIAQVKANENCKELISKFDSRIHDIWSKSYKVPFLKESFFDPEKHSFLETLKEAERSKNLFKNQLNDIRDLIIKVKENSASDWTTRVKSWVGIFSEAEVKFNNNFNQKIQEFVDDVPSPYMCIPKEKRSEIEPTLKNFQEFIPYLLTKDRILQVEDLIVEFSNKLNANNVNLYDSQKMAVDLHLKLIEKGVELGLLRKN
jgi:hypothetical protein